jgi:hypothetical protein
MKQEDKVKKGTKVIANRSGGMSRLLMGLHDSIGNKGSRYLISTKPATIQTLHSLLSGFNTVEFNVDLALQD